MVAEGQADFNLCLGDSMQRNYREYKGYLMLFGLFRIRKDVAFGVKTSGAPSVMSKDILERHTEPLIQKLCTIKWVETDFFTDPEECYL